MSALQAKKHLLEQTVRLEEEVFERENAESREKMEAQNTKEELQKAAAQQIQSELAIQREEANRKRLLDDLKADTSVPRSLVKIMQEQCGNINKISLFFPSIIKYLFSFFQSQIHWVRFDEMQEECLTLPGKITSSTNQIKKS